MVSDWQLFEDQRYEELVERYQEWILYALRTTGPDCEDLAQQVWIRIIKAQPKRRQSFKGYLLMIAKNLRIDWYRKNSRRKTVALPDELPAPTSEDDGHLASVDQLRWALEQLEGKNARWLALFKLRYEAGLSNKEIAAMKKPDLGTDPRAIAMAVLRATRFIEGLLK